MGLPSARHSVTRERMTASPSFGLQSGCVSIQGNQVNLAKFHSHMLLSAQILNLAVGPPKCLMISLPFLLLIKVPRRKGSSALPRRCPHYALNKACPSLLGSLAGTPRRRPMLLSLCIFSREKPHPFTHPPSSTSTEKPHCVLQPGGITHVDACYLVV